MHTYTCRKEVYVKWPASADLTYQYKYKRAFFTCEFYLTIDSKNKLYKFKGKCEKRKICVEVKADFLWKTICHSRVWDRIMWKVNIIIILYAVIQNCQPFSLEYKSSLFCHMCCSFRRFLFFFHFSDFGGLWNIKTHTVIKFLLNSKTRSPS